MEMYTFKAPSAIFPCP